MSLLNVVLRTYSKYRKMLLVAFIVLGVAALLYVAWGIIATGIALRYVRL